MKRLIGPIASALVLGSALSAEVQTPKVSFALPTTAQFALVAEQVQLGGIEEASIKSV